MIVFVKAHPVTQAMSGAAKPADLMEPGLRRNPGEPDAAQAEANSYIKPTVKWQGLAIAIENPAGSVRRGRNRHGVTWEVRMRFDYGEIVGTLGVDGDPVDVIVGPDLDAPMVYVVHQRKVNDWTNYDEDKCCVGFASQADAEAAFLSNYNDPRFLGPVTAMPAAEFVAKVKATKEKPAMIKSAAPLVLFFKAHVGAYVRGGRMVSGYQGRDAKPAEGQMSLFGGPESGKPLKPSPLQGKDAVVHTPDMFGAADDAPEQKPHDLLKDALKRKDLASAISILTPMSREEALESLLRAGFSIFHSKTKQELMAGVQSQLSRAARDGKDGYEMRESRDADPAPTKPSLTSKAGDLAHRLRGLVDKNVAEADRARIYAGEANRLRVTADKMVSNPDVKRQYSEAADILDGWAKTVAQR